MVSETTQMEVAAVWRRLRHAPLMQSVACWQGSLTRAPERHLVPSHRRSIAEVRG